MGGVGQHRASPVVFSYAVSMHSTPNRRAYARALGSILEKARSCANHKCCV
ncbi:hypothetical protein BURPSPAST_AA0180 [Burkholderia pseudomallei Pasteur 52237]|nr:hypothetical protein BURPSPAST_AA0180 [Burkholderia pseudomallei Pasteur 52237]